MALRGARVVRSVVAGLLLVAMLAPVSVWADAPVAEECHGCCPEVIRAAALPDCCMVAPDAPAPPQPPLRVTGTAAPLAAPAPVVLVWDQPTVPADRPETGDPPRRSIPLLQQTSVLLI